MIFGRGSLSNTSNKIPLMKLEFKNALGIGTFLLVLGQRVVSDY